MLGHHTPPPVKTRGGLLPVMRADISCYFLWIIRGPDNPPPFNPDYPPPTVTFGRGYKYPLTSSSPSCSSWTRTPPIVGATKLQDLPPQPTKALDLWRIEGGGLDLHPHWSDLLSTLICLRDLCLGFPWIPRPWFVYSISWYLLFDSIMLSFGASYSVVDACPKILKAGSTLRNPLVESELGLCGGSLQRIIGRAFVALVRPLWQPHPSNIDVLPLKRKELPESHPCLCVLHSWLPLPFIAFTYYILLSLLIVI
jgi:hypothetical protein